MGTSTIHYDSEYLSNEILWLKTYNSYRIVNAMGNKVRNPAFDKISGYLLDLKDPKSDKHNAVVSACAGSLSKFIDKFELPAGEFIAASVPSHLSGRWSVGLENILNQTKSKKYTLVVHPKLVRRTNDIDKLAYGGNREVQKHLDSIKIDNPQLVNGKVVFLLDDITTSGNSFHACRHLLQEAGAKIVICVAIGKTA